jgi:stage V sporulation protein G
MNEPRSFIMKTNIELTAIKVYPFKQAKGKIKAFAQVVLNGALRLNGLKVIEGDNGLFIGFPSEKGKDGTFYSIYHPINRESRSVIQDAVLANYEAAVSA